MVDIAVGIDYAAVNDGHKQRSVDVAGFVVVLVLAVGFLVAVAHGILVAPWDSS